MNAAEHHAMALVREADHDRYLCALYAPAEHRGDLFALYAFNAEIAAVRERISEALAGEIRLQWWRDTFAAGGGPEAAQGHPVAEALLCAIARHRLPVATFSNYLDARVFDLYDDPMPTRTDLEGYCGETASALIQLAALVLDRDAAQTTAELAGHAGCAQAMTGLLLLLPIHRRRGQCYFPLDMLSAAGVTRESFLSGEDREGAQRAVAAMAALARSHLSAFREGAGALSASLRPAYLPLALSEAYLRRIESGAVDPLDDVAAISPPRRHWLVLARALRGW